MDSQDSSRDIQAGHVLCTIHLSGEYESYRVCATVSTFLLPAPESRPRVWRRGAASRSTRITSARVLPHSLRRRRRRWPERRCLHRKRARPAEARQGSGLAVARRSPHAAASAAPPAAAFPGALRHGADGHAPGVDEWTTISQTNRPFSVRRRLLDGVSLLPTALCLLRWKRMRSADPATAYARVRKRRLQHIRSSESS
jgi:hypothetical protein